MDDKDFFIQIPQTTKKSRPTTEKRIEDIAELSTVVVTVTKCVDWPSTLDDAWTCCVSVAAAGELSPAPDNAVVVVAAGAFVNIWVVLVVATTSIDRNWTCFPPGITANKNNRGSASDVANLRSQSQF